MVFWLKKILFGKNKLTLFKKVFERRSFRYFREAIFLIRHPQNTDLLEISKSGRTLFVDVGAFEGNFAELFKEKYPNSDMILIEPISSFVDSMRKRFTEDSVEIVQAALTSDGRNLKLFVADASTSIFHQENAIVTEVPSISVANLSSKIARRNVSLLQINCEGAEYEILPEIIGLGLINDIEALNIQFHNLSVSNMLKHLRIRRDLSKTHKLAWSTYFIWERWEKKIEEGTSREYDPN